MIDREELNDQERAVCEQGGGYVILSDSLFSGLQWK